MTYKELLSRISCAASVEQDVVDSVIRHLSTVAISSVGEGDEVRIPGFGKFCLRRYPARQIPFKSEPKSHLIFRAYQTTNTRLTQVCDDREKSRQLRVRKEERNVVGG